MRFTLVEDSGTDNPHDDAEDEESNGEDGVVCGDFLCCDAHLSSTQQGQRSRRIARHQRCTEVRPGARSFGSQPMVEGRSAWVGALLR